MLLPTVLSINPMPWLCPMLWQAMTLHLRQATVLLHRTTVLFPTVLSPIPALLRTLDKTVALTLATLAFSLVKLRTLRALPISECATEIASGSRVNAKSIALDAKVVAAEVVVLATVEAAILAPVMGVVARSKSDLYPYGRRSFASAI
jgi:hypothetical protein